MIKKYQLQLQIQAVCQGVFSIQDFYTKLHMLWDQLELLEQIELQANPAFINYWEKQHWLNYWQCAKEDCKSVRYSFSHHMPLPIITAGMSKLIAEKTHFDSLSLLSDIRQYQISSIAIANTSFIQLTT